MKKIRLSLGTVYILLTLFIAALLFMSLAGSFNNKNSVFEYDLTNKFSYGLIDYPFFPVQTQIDREIVNPLKFGKHNLRRLLGREAHYIWLKTVFTVPDELKGEDLALFIDYIHFSDKVWINNHFAGQMGNFPPNESSPLYLTHSYFFPKENLNQDGENTILIKVFSYGKAEISGRAILSTQSNIRQRSTIKSFVSTYCYMLMEGGMFIAMVLFFFLFLLQNRRREYLWFSVLNLCTIIFGVYFFMPIVPFYASLNIPYYKYYRAIMCFPGILNFMLFIPFVRFYIGIGKNKPLEVIRLLLFIVQFIVLMSTRNYDELMKLSLPILLMTFVHIGIALYYLFKGYSIKKCRHKAVVFTVCLGPFVLSMLIDLLLRLGLSVTTLPYFSYYGWQLTIIAFLFVLSHNHAKTAINNEYLNKNLELEVQKQTENLYTANERLMERIHRSNIDLQMAAIVQQKFFPYPKKNYKGWDLAVSYEPLSEVSGDFFDYYSLGINLDGISLFDVSGHGVAASLVTMLSKNIVYNAFQKARFYDVPISRCLMDVNHDLIVAKGSIDNYMTGIMMRFSNFNDDDSCKVDFANAGHPHPILYSAKKDECMEITGDTGQEQFGAIGMANIEVKYRDVSFEMEKDDVLVIYTDGLTEAENIRHAQFSRQGIKDVLMQHHGKNAHVIVKEIDNAVKSFMGEADRKDDITIIVLKREDSSDFLEALDSD